MLKKSSAEWLTLLRLKALCVGRLSSRKIGRACYEDQAFSARRRKDHCGVCSTRAYAIIRHGNQLSTVAIETA